MATETASTNGDEIKNANVTPKRNTSFYKAYEQRHRGARTKWSNSSEKGC
jgi:hypothetical protein